MIQFLLQNSSSFSISPIPSERTHVTTSERFFPGFPTPSFLLRKHFSLPSTTALRLCCKLQTICLHNLLWCPWRQCHNADVVRAFQLESNLNKLSHFTAYVVWYHALFIQRISAVSTNGSSVSGLSLYMWFLFSVHPNSYINFSFMDICHKKWIIFMSVRILLKIDAIFSHQVTCAFTFFHHTQSVLNRVT